MPKPATNVRVRLDIAASMMGVPFLAQQAGAIAYKLSPVYEVPKQSGEYGDIAPKELLTVGDDRRRNSDGSYKRSTIRFSDRNYATKEFGGEGTVDERDSHKFEDYFDHELVVGQVEMNRNVLAKEKRIADKAMDSANFVGQTTPAGSTWDAWKTSNPGLDIHNAKKAQWKRTGIRPNVGYCSENTFLDLINNDEVFRKIHSEGAGDPAKPSDITIEMLKKVFLLEDILVGGMSINKGNINQDLDIDGVWSDDYFGLAFIDRTNNIAVPTAFRTFHWDVDGSRIGGTVEDYFEDNKRTHVVRVREDVDEQEPRSDLKQLVTGVR